MSKETSKSLILWKVNVVTLKELAALFSEILEEFADSVTFFENADYEEYWTCAGYFREKPDVEQLQERFMILSEALGCDCPTVQLEAVPRKNWLLENQQQFPPISIGRFWLYGSHETSTPPKASLPLCVNAATAFGSGEHETTKGCLLAIEEIFKKSRPKKILDLGTGSGILAMAIAKLQKTKIDATDLDPESVHVTKENAKLNRLQPYLNVFQSHGFRQIQPKYDLIVANILARPLRQMSKDFKNHIEYGGVVILSGLLVTQMTYVQNAFRAQGFHLEKTYQLKPWAVLVMRYGSAFSHQKNSASL